MKTNFKIIPFCLFFILGIATFHSCKQDDYYIDGGLANPVFNGSVLDYLNSKPREFDSIAQIIKLAGLENDFKNNEITFFAPRDESVKKLIGTVRGGGLNARLYTLGRDTITKLSDVDSLIWRKYMMKYMFRGKHKLMDYPQIDFNLLNVFGGQNYTSMEGSVCKIGVFYNDAGGIKYMGYRQLQISYIPDLTQPNRFNTIPIASSDIQPSNGVVHVLDYTRAEFGYSSGEISNEILESKR